MTAIFRILSATWGAWFLAGLMSRWTNSAGQPVKTQPLNIQIDIPCEECGDKAAAMAAVNWGKVFAAAMSLIIALMTGNTAGIATAIQALIAAIMGN